LRPLSLLTASLALAAIFAGCGGKKASSPTTPTTPTSTTSVAANTAYERSYSDCASNQPADLARQFDVKNNRVAIATAVGRYWAKRAGGGADAAFAGKQGCFDGLAFAEGR
jgi:hypothetical protein